MAATLGVTGWALSPTALAAQLSSTGDCGPLPNDPHFVGRLSGARAFAADAAAAETSYNGWPVGTPASAIGVANFTVPGSTVVLPVKSGDVATVMMYVAGRFNQQVEALRSGQCWGYDYRKNVNNTSVWSNHASGTAIDLNAVLHPNGAAVSYNFDAGKVAAIRAILSFCGDVIYWGGDYSGTVDAMHFEIDVAPGDSRLPTLVSKIASGGFGGQRVALRSRANGRFVTAESAGQRPLIANRDAASTWEQFVMVDRGSGDVALVSSSNNTFVCAEAGGASPLIANRYAPSTWETFALIRNGDGTVSLRSRANGRFVCAEAAGGSSLIANRDAIGSWEQFDLVSL